LIASTLRSKQLLQRCL